MVQAVGLPVALLLTALWSGARGLWLFGSTHRLIVERYQHDLDEMTTDRDFWRAEALRGTDLAERAIGHAEQIATAVAVAPRWRPRRGEP